MSTASNVRFRVGKQYKNREFVYTVLTIEGDAMQVVRDDGSKQTLSMRIQRRIIERMLLDNGPRKYQSHCWSCQSHISSEDLPHCAKCGWFMCGSCSACGCGYAKRWSFARVDFGG